MASKLIGAQNGMTKMRYNGSNVGTENWRDPVSGFTYKFSKTKPLFMADTADVERFLDKRLPTGLPLFSVVVEEVVEKPVEPKGQKHVTEREDIATEPAWAQMSKYAITPDMIQGTGAPSALGKNYNRISLKDVDAFIETLTPQIEERITAQAVTEAETLGVDPRQLLLRHPQEEGRIGVRHVRDFHKSIQDAFAGEEDES